MRETRADVGELIDEPRRGLGHALHVAAVARMQDAARNEVADLPAVLHHFRTLAQHLGRDAELLFHDGRRALLFREVERGFPARDGHLARNVFGELHRIFRTVLEAEAGDGAAETQEAHAMTALAHDLLALLLERQAV